MLYHYKGQLSLAIPPWVGAMSTSESWGVNRHTARYTSPVSMVSQCKLVSGWGLRKRRSAPPYGPLWLWKDFTLLTFITIGLQTATLGCWTALRQTFFALGVSLKAQVLSLDLVPCGLVNTTAATTWTTEIKNQLWHAGLRTTKQRAAVLARATEAPAGLRIMPSETINT